MDDDDPDLVAALELTQVGEQRRDLARDVLVDAVQADERVEDEEARPERGDGRGEAVAIPGVIEAEGRRGDHVDLQRREVDAGGAADALQAPANEMQGILGGVEQHAAGPTDRVLPQAGGAGGDRDGQGEGEAGLAALGLAADDADRLLSPEVLDPPAALVGPVGEAVRERDRAEDDRPGPPTAALSA